MSLHDQHLDLCAAVDRRLVSNPPTLEVVRAALTQRVYGWANPETRTIRIYEHPLWPRVWVDLTHLHELVHLSGKAGCATHGTRFKRALLRSAENAWGLNFEDHRALAQMPYRELERRIGRRLIVKRFLEG